MDLQLLIDRILECENLTDNLEDAQADQLLHWGVSRLPEAVGSTSSMRLAGGKANHVIAIMRSINQLVGDRQALPPEELEKGLKTIGERFQRAFGRACPAQEKRRRQEIAAKLPPMTSQEALTLLLDLLN